MISAMDLSDVIKKLREMLGFKGDPPGDPYSKRPVPVRRTPPDRSGAVAVAEPDDE